MANRETVETFFRCFGRLDADGMIQCLSDNIVYNDQIYGIIKAEEVRALWRMRCENFFDMDLKILEYREIDHEYITCRWQAAFCSQVLQKKRVEMTLTSYMRLSGGKITEQSDAYKLSQWLAKAYGLTGILLGWTGWMKKREQAKYREMLANYIQSLPFFENGGKRHHDYDFADR